MDDLPQEVKEWTMDHVALWLDLKGFGAYKHKFAGDC